MKQAHPEIVWRRKGLGSADGPAELQRFVSNLAVIEIGGLVFDFDGTLVEAGSKFERPPRGIVEDLERLIQHGMRIGIATGRGDSVREVLRGVLPVRQWPSVLIGYRNGSEIGGLSDSTVPASTPPRDVFLLEARRRLDADEKLVGSCTVRVSSGQLAIQFRDRIERARLEVDLRELLADLTDLKVVSSTVSIDVLPRSVSKVSVLDQIQATLANGLGVGSIGDSGDENGNDFELLAHPAGLSVGTVSNDTKSCWNLSPTDAPGSSITQLYLSSLQPVRPGVMKFDLAALGF